MIFLDLISSSDFFNFGTGGIEPWRAKRLTRVDPETRRRDHWLDKASQQWPIRCAEIIGESNGYILYNFSVFRVYFLVVSFPHGSRAADAGKVICHRAMRPLSRRYMLPC